MGVSKVRSQKQNASWYCICDVGFVRSSCTSLCGGGSITVSFESARVTNIPLGCENAPLRDLWCVRVLVLGGPDGRADLLHGEDPFEALHADVLALGVVRIPCHSLSQLLADPT